MPVYKTKRFGKNRIFLNPMSDNCMAALGWSVSLEIISREDEATKCYLDASFEVNEEGRRWDVNRLSNLKQIQKAQTELDKFETACYDAIDWAKEKGLELYKE